MFHRPLKKLFIPHEGNNFRPNFLERVSVGIMLGLMTLTFTGANLHALFWISSDWLVSTILPSVLVDLTNEKRNEGALTTLVHNPLLDLAAQKKAEDMAKNGYFAHYSPEGRSPWYWFDQVGYNYLAAGENLAVHFIDSSAVVDAWMNSPTHRDNIMNGMYREIGIGTAKGTYKGVETIFVVQLFGVPKAQAVVLGEETIAQGEELAAQPEMVQPERTDPFRANETVSTPAVPRNEISTTTGFGVPATIDRAGTEISPTTGVIARSAVSPSGWLTFMYGLLASVVVIALMLSIVIEWRRQHPIQIAYASALLVVLAFLTYAHVTLVGGVLIA